MHANKMRIEFHREYHQCAAALAAKSIHFKQNGMMMVMIRVGVNIPFLCLSAFVWVVYVMKGRANAARFGLELTSVFIFVCTQFGYLVTQCNVCIKSNYSRLCTLAVEILRRRGNTYFIFWEWKYRVLWSLLKWIMLYSAHGTNAHVR